MPDYWLDIIKLFLKGPFNAHKNIESGEIILNLVKKNFRTVFTTCTDYEKAYHERKVTTKFQILMQACSVLNWAVEHNKNYRMFIRTETQISRTDNTGSWTIIIFFYYQNICTCTIWTVFLSLLFALTVEQTFVQIIAKLLNLLVFFFMSVFHKWNSGLKIWP